MGVLRRGTDYRAIVMTVAERADLSRSKLQPHTGPSKNRWPDRKHRCPSDVIALVEQILHRDKHIEPVAQAVLCAGVEGEITSQ